MANKLRIGEIVLDRGRHQIHRDGVVRAIEPRLVRLLEALCREPGATVLRDKLLEEVSSLPYAGDEALTQAMSKLRQALGDSSRDPRYIKTISRKGYVLVADVEAIEDAPSAANSWLSHLPARLLWAALGGAAAVMALLGYLYFFGGNDIEIELDTVDDLQRPEPGEQEFIEKDEDTGTEDTGTEDTGTEEPS